MFVRYHGQKKNRRQLASDDLHNWYRFLSWDRRRLERALRKNGRFSTPQWARFGLLTPSVFADILNAFLDRINSSRMRSIYFGSLCDCDLPMNLSALWFRPRLFNNVLFQPTFGSQQIQELSFAGNSTAFFGTSKGWADLSLTALFIIYIKYVREEAWLATISCCCRKLICRASLVYWLYKSR